MPIKSRDWDNPVYKEFRQNVKKRDGGKCLMCEKKKSKLQVHHIQKWSTAAHLRYEVSNGISLCWDCHASIKGLELHYVSYFYELVRQSEEASKSKTKAKPIKRAKKARKKKGEI